MIIDGRNISRIIDGINDIYIYIYTYIYIIFFFGINEYYIMDIYAEFIDIY